MSERRFSRENFNRPGYERALTEFRELIRTPDASVPTTAADLAELERLIRRYPDNARYLVAQLPPPATPP